ncbi:MAG: GntR family transcriptional regulator [Spirochaetales bacterium]|nr:GntR family transcriptional regulator [Spirochaetales bacterium]
MANYKVKSQDLVEKVHSMIRLMILRNQLVPGQKLIQEELAEKLGVSRTPLLSALSKLEKEFLVESLPRRGYYVRKLSRQEELDLFDIRLQLEPLAARRAAANITPKGARDLMTRAEISPKQRETMDQKSFCEYDYHFHSLIQELSGNEFLHKMTSSYNIISLSNQNIVTEFDYSIGQHLELARLIGEGKASEAESLMEEHISQARRRIVALAD